MILPLKKLNYLSESFGKAEHRMTEDRSNTRDIAGLPLRQTHLYFSAAITWSKQLQRVGAGVITVQSQYLTVDFL